jgi:plastocyanin
MGSTRRLVAAGVLLCGLALASCAPSEGAGDRPKPKTHTVYMEGMMFRPRTIVVAAGDTIVWINRDFVGHTATSPAAAFDSKLVEANKSWRFTPMQKGQFEYVCTLHPTMKGTLQVN